MKNKIVQLITMCTLLLSACGAKESEAPSPYKSVTGPCGLVLDIPNECNEVEMTDNSVRWDWAFDATVAYIEVTVHNDYSGDQILTATGDLTPSDAVWGDFSEWDFGYSSTWHYYVLTDDNACADVAYTVYADSRHVAQQVLKHISKTMSFVNFDVA